MARSWLVPILLGALLWAACTDLRQVARAYSPVSLDQYRNTIIQVLTLAQQGDSQSGAERAATLARAADALAAIHEVTLSSGERITVDNSELATLLRDPNKTGNALTRLGALRDVLAEPLVRINADDLAALHKLVQRPATEQNPAASWLDDLLQRISESVYRLFNNTAQGIFDVRYVLVVLGALVVVGVALYFVLNLRRNLVADEALPPLAVEEAVRSPREAFDNAQRFVGAGDYRRAVRQLYLATLLLLDQSGRIKYDPTLTNREYLQQAAADPQAAAALQPIVETFDRTWYGFQPLSPQEFEVYRQRVERVGEL